MTRNKHLSPFLIGLSLIFLAGFLMMWNWNTYQNEQTQLKKSLDYQLQLVQGEIRDSLLYTFVNISSDSLNEDEFQFRPYLNTSAHFNSSTTIIGIDDKGSIPDFQITHSKDSFPNTSNHSPVKNTNISINGERIVTIIRDSITDILPNKSKVTQRFVEKLNTEGLPRQFEVIVMMDSIESKNLSIPFQENFFDQHRSEIVFSDYKWYLFKKILPSLLTSLVLFLLVFITFWTLYQSKLKQGRLIAIKNEFVSNMTHELKTPISTVSVALEALSEFGVAQDPKRSREYIDISKHELKRLNILVDKVLKMSSFENDEVPLNKEKVDLKNLLEDIQNSMQLHLSNNKVELEIDTSLNQLQVDADPVHLTNVIYNIIDNAIKYSDDNPEIKITLKERDDSIELGIKDNGIGIPNEYQSKIFDRFFRIPHGDTHDVKGYGLGLHYVKKIIERHRGNIRVSSKINKGTAFIIQLPKADSNV